MTLLPGLNYGTYKTQIAQMAVVSPADANFLAILPSMIDYAELRILRDLDLMVTSVAKYGANFKLTAGNRNISFPQFDATDGTSFVVSEQINLLTPAGSTDPQASTRSPLIPTTKEFLDAVYGSSTSANRAQPQYFAPFNETLFFVGPVPDATYYVEVIGTVRPASLTWAASPDGGNLGDAATTFISQYLPDLFIMASMIYISAYQRNFGRQSDDPQMAVSYESQYQALLRSAGTEEARKKYEGAAWSSQSPAQSATPTRG